MSFLISSHTSSLPSRLAGVFLGAALLLGAVACGGSGKDRADVVVVATGDSVRLLPYLYEAGASPELVAGKTTDVLDIDFETAAGFRHVTGASAASKLVRDVAIRDGALHYGAEADGNRLAWECALDAADVTHVEIEGIATSDTRGPVHLLWQGPEQSAEQWYHAAFIVPVDGSSHDVRVPLEDSPGWAGPIVRMALQFGVPMKKTIDDGAVPIRLDAISYKRMDLGTRRKADGVPMSIRRIVIERESRAVAHAPAPSSHALHLEVPEAAHLDFGIGVHPASANKKGDGVRFRVTFRGDGDRDETVLFERTVDPRRNPAERGWLDLRVDLAELAGRRGTLCFSTDPLEDDAHDDALWAHPTLYTEPVGGAPNIILVSLDTVRADHLGCYGYKSETAPDRPTTPAIDAFAGRALLFERASSTAPETVAAHMSLFTSLYPEAHGIEQIYDQKVLNDKVPLFAELLGDHDAPYATAAFTEGGGLHYSVGFDRGFDRYSIGEIQPERKNKMLESTFRNATKWLENNAERRFFLFVHSYEAHTPYEPPAPYDTMFYPDYKGDIAPPIAADTIEELVIQRKIAYGGDGVKRIVSLYDGALRYLDEYVGEFLAKVENLGLLEDTIVVLFSDHGEDFFDHFSVATHGHSLYEEMVHVPLIIRLPGKQDRSARIDHQVSLIDLMPTLLALAGVDGPEDAQGLSRVPLVNGETMAETPIYMEDTTGIRRAAIRIGDKKRILSPGIEQNPILDLIRRFGDVIALDRFEGMLEEVEFYDLLTDPGERRNLLHGKRVEGPGYLCEPLRDQLLDNHARKARAMPQKGAALDAGTQERLGELGYTADEEPPAPRSDKKSGDGIDKKPWDCPN